MAQIVSIGEKFPKFELPAVVGDEFGTISSEDLKDAWAVVFYWPLDFTPVCPTELVEFNRLVPAFQERGAKVFGISHDSKYVHRAWKNSHRELKQINYPILADHRQELSRELGILHPTAKLLLRATYILDPQGTVRWLGLNDIEVGRNVEEVLRVLDALQTGNLCPVNWKRGQLTL